MIEGGETYKGVVPCPRCQDIHHPVDISAFPLKSKRLTKVKDAQSIESVPGQQFFY